MKRFLLTVLAGFAAFPLAFAQSETVVVEPFLGGGLAIGIPGGDAALALQGGADNLLGPLALRGVFNIYFEGGASLAVDVINYFPQTRQLAPYLGGGLEIALSDQAYGLHALGGLEYFVDDDIALFAELQPTYFIVPDGDSDFGAGLRFGANYHFD